MLGDLVGHHATHLRQAADVVGGRWPYYLRVVEVDVAIVVVSTSEGLAGLLLHIT